jgi:tetratricopeptide (TPR) repeat protein
MFGFKKKDTEKKTAAQVPEEVPANHDELVKEAENLLAQAKTCSSEMLVDLYNKAGAAFDLAGELDRAIESYELSFTEKREMGPASKALQSLYNKKRQQLAKAGDSAGAMDYLNKMQTIMQVAKDQLRGK